MAGDDDAGQPRRAGPPPGALNWVAETVGGTVVRVRRLPGSTSSVLHEMVVVSGAGDRRSVVLRRYTHPLWRDGGAELAAREAVALVAARTAPVAAPELLGVDLAGDETGVPAVLMSRAPGRPVLHGGAGWLEELGRLYEQMATWSAPAVDLAPYAPWYPPDPAPPSWSGYPASWQEAIDRVITAAAPPGPIQPIHRDLHPANIVFRRGRATAVVDWVNACVGPFGSDLARGRANLAVLAGPDAADAFLVATGEAGRAYDPWWDLSVCVELLPDPSSIGALRALGGRCDVTSARAALDDLLLRALASLR